MDVCLTRKKKISTKNPTAKLAIKVEILNRSIKKGTKFNTCCINASMNENKYKINCFDILSSVHIGNAVCFGKVLNNSYGNLKNKNFWSIMNLAKSFQ